MQVISSEADLRALRAEWEGLYRVAGAGNPFTQWHWVWHWWRFFGASHPLRRYRLNVYVLRDTDWQARGIVPFVLTRWGRFPLAVRALRLYGFRDNTTELPAPLIWPGWEASVCAGVLAALRAQSGTFDWCLLEGVPAGGELYDGIAAAMADAGGIWGSPTRAYVLPLPGTWEALRARLKRNVKENIRHSYNSLGREGHHWQFECVTDAAALPGALGEFFRLHTARSVMSNAPHHPDHYRAAPARAFLRALATDLAPSGQFRVCRLRVNGDVVASRIVLTASESVFLSYSGFDPRWRRYGVMTLLTTECIKQAIAAGARDVNLSTGTDASKLRWGPEERSFESVTLFAPTRRARLAARLHHAALSAKKRWQGSIHIPA